MPPLFCERAGCSDAFLVKITEERSAEGGRLALSLPALRFSTRPRASRSRELRLKNTGTNALRVTVGEPLGPFAVLSGGGSFTLAPRERRTVRVYFGPTQVGRFVQGLAITSSDPRKAVVHVRLVGRAGR